VESVRCDLQYSRLAAASIAAAALASALVAGALPAAMPWRAAALALIAIEAWRAWRHSRAVRTLALGLEGGVEVVLREGRLQRGVVRPGSFVAPWLVIVRWRPAGARRDAFVLVLPDMAPAEALRRLRVILRWA
jgi:hypothetical protein